jgi:periplasmic copper chaperone A
MPAWGELVAVERRIFRAAAALAALAASAVLAACGVGFDAPTEQVEPEYPSGDVGPILVRSLMLIQKEGGGPATAVVTLVNTSAEPETLRSLQIAPPQAPGTTPSPTSSPLDVPASVTIPPGGAVHLGAQGQPSVTIDGLDQLAEPGQTVPVTLMFDKAGRLTLDAIVQSGVGPFASFAPTAEPTPTGSIPVLPTGSASEAAASGSPTGSPS